jgi:predicted secreted protein
MSVFPRLAATLALGLGVLASLPTQADDLHYNQVSLRAEVNREVAHDRMYVTLFSEDQNKDPAALAAGVTSTLNAAIDKARKVKGVTVSMGSRSSAPVYDDDGRKIVAWRERGELRLESADFASLSRLTGDLLDSLKMDNMSFAIATDTRRKAEDELLKDAVAAFKARAQLASEALGAKGYKIVSLNLNSAGFQPQPMRAMAMRDASFSKAAPAPQIEAGSSQVVVSADGVIEVSMP